MMKLPTFATPAFGYALLAMAVVIGIEQVRIYSLKADVALLRQAAADDRAARTKLVADHVVEKAKLQADHAAQTQENLDEYQTKLAARDAAVVARDVVAVGLRRDLATYAARGGRAGETDTARAERAEDRLSTLAGLLDTGIGLVGESQGVIEGRDAEVMLLLEQVHIDRRACSSGNNPR